ncbi:CPBP family intramembrane glutamic endopeptidase [Nocardioides sp.]|uniref:CPBP family intramembrane glutamic endopeptidase n=1 Tax=Nocardioides sp. TaxID=35761 RepID=UPI00199314C1|nr:CPBP family intramembrane glutamic endopeptidase [Nocardioides sp.]MBC7278876.1 CPBP family intramembrane metalloprotease [Nocardioides sp.]
MKNASPSLRWKVSAVALVVLGFVAVFGLGTWAAIQILLDPAWAEDKSYSVSSIGRNAAVGAVVVVLVTVIARAGLRIPLAEQGWRWPASPAFGALGALGLAYLAMWVGFQAWHAVDRFFPQREVSVTPSDTSDADVFSALSAVNAGITEEILLLAIPIAVMTRLKWHVGAQLLVLIAMRLSIHLYYGPQAIVLCVVWVLGLWLVYRKVRAVWPFILAHITYDLVAGNSVFPREVRLGLAALSIALLIVGLVAAVTWGVRSIKAGGKRKEEPLPS